MSSDNNCRECGTAIPDNSQGGLCPRCLLERQWAAGLLERVLLRLRQEYAAAGKQALFEKLLSCLPGAQSQVPYGEMAAGLGMKEVAVRMAAHRLRRRYGELLRAEIALTGFQ